jgi:hypothetical protein
MDLPVYLNFHEMELDTPQTVIVEKKRLGFSFDVFLRH